MTKISTARFDADLGYPWDDVMDKADGLSEMLIKEKFSSQDIAHIGLRLMHIGNFAWALDSAEYAEKKVKKLARNAPKN